MPRLRWVVLAVAAAVVALGATWGTGVFGSLSGGGFADPASESSRAHDRITAELGQQGYDLLVLYRSEDATVDQPAFRDPVTATLDRLRGRPAVAQVTSWYDSPVPALVATDRHATYALVRLRGADQDDKTAALADLRPELDAPGLHTRVGGTVAFQRSANEQTTRDITRAEMFSLPVLLVLLVLIFRGLVAALLPLIIGGFAILGAFVAVRLLSTATEVSIFAINVITLLGLGMAVDYSLFVVSRFREELAAGRDVRSALARTVATAGRTVLVSGLTVALALASLLIFPQSFLSSLGWGGMAAVLVAMLGALTVLPAVLAVLGRRVDALRVPVPWRRRTGRGPARGSTAPTDDPVPGPVATDGAGRAWARIAHSVMRRPVRYVVGVVAVLALLATPFLRVTFGGFDERILPAGTEARVVSDQIRADFPGGSVGPVDVLVSGAPVARAEELAGRIRALPDVVGARVTAHRDDASLIEVDYPGEPTGPAAQRIVRAIRDLPAEPGVRVLVGGRTAADLDLLASLGDRLPWMALVMAAATLVLLFLAFGSVLLPVKAVLMNLISIGASFGVMVWVFQDGHFADQLGFTPTGFIEPSNPILMLAVLFGLATDYEVFLLSRVREEWDRTGDNTAAVAAGLQHTGRIITAAATLLIVVVAGFATGGIAFVKLIGVGMIVAILVDATLVRALLVPATMRLLGRWNWWAPGPLARIHRRFGIRETAAEEPGRPEPATAQAGAGAPSGLS
ncbi:MMPL family transporter [Micromonospora zhanjiangensis]|uniref:MMPL family transporter n=1 Tax=Micromonospora zhanjiangensis TaxID=1522057 RepID=UPI003671AE3E